jgi:hypothetical protein
MRLQNREPICKAPPQPAAAAPRTLPASPTLQSYLDHCRRYALAAATRMNQTLIPRLVEEFEVRPALALAGRHQEAVAADEIVILANHDVVVTFGADIFEPYWLLATEVALLAIMVARRANPPRVVSSLSVNGV